MDAQLLRDLPNFQLDLTLASMHKHTIPGCTFLFSRVKGLIIFSGMLLLFQFSVWTAQFCMRFALKGGVLTYEIGLDH